MRSPGEALGEVPDHRSRLGQGPGLSALLGLMRTGLLCGCQSLQALRGWGKRQEGALLRAMGFGRERASGERPERASPRTGVVELGPGHVEAAGGRRRLAGSGSGRQGIARQSAGGDGPATTHEAKACLPFLEGLSLTNRVVTGDAAFMQGEGCLLIIKQQGHSFIVLKANQPALHQTVHDWFAAHSGVFRRMFKSFGDGEN